MGKIINDSTYHALERSEKIETVIIKIRRVVKIFRRSPVKNGGPQKNCQVEFNKELNLVTDTRTRWNSSLKMLLRFLEIRTVVQKTLKDLHQSSKCFDENEVSLTKEQKKLSKFLKLGPQLSLVMMSHYCRGKKFSNSSFKI